MIFDKLKKLLQECIEEIEETESIAVGYGEPEPEFDWGIIIPHTKNSPGARSVAKNINEYQYALQMVKDMPYSYETRDEGGVALAAKRLAMKGCNALLEPHKNAFNGEAKGFEILVIDGDSESTRVAELIAQNFKQAFPDRVLRRGTGIKKLKKGDRGYQNLLDAKKSGVKIALLSEDFFIDNPNEWIEPAVLAKFWNANLKK
jgi:hypothetical protein